MLDVRCDLQFSGFPESIKLTGEVLRELGGVDHQQGFVVGVSSGRRPVEAPRDHCFVVDHGELVVQVLEMGLPACVLRDAQGI